MEFDQRSLLIAVAAACGILMIVGAFFLLYRGVIKLEPPDNSRETELEVFKVLKLKTNIAALVLFVLGFAFLALGFYNVSPPPPHFQLSGRLVGMASNDYVQVLVCGGPWPVSVLTDGSFNHEVKPDLDTYEVRIRRVGYPLEQSIGVFMKRSRQKEPTPAYGFISIDDDLVARIGEIKLEGEPLSHAPQPIDRVTNQPAPSFGYGSK